MLFGVIIDNKVKWNDHLTYVKSKISRIIGPFCKMRQYLGKKALVNIYYNLVFLGTSSVNLDPIIKFFKKCVRIMFSDSLLFTEHISQLCIKAGRKINVLSRLCCSLTTEAKLLLMQAFILSHFNFCSIIWHYCSMRDLRKIEK